MKNKNFLISLVCSFVFFIIAFLTLPSYGPSWDETLHFSRGQVYVNYFLTGKKEYPKNEARKSFYQIPYQAGDFWFKENGGHPPISGILASISNTIFYKKLGILSDIHSYHFFNIFVSSFIVFVVVYLTATVLGFIPSVISFLALFTYPLFFSESHFNVKDPAETAFFSLTILFFFLFVAKRKIKWIIASSLAFALALGTKFNIVFLPFILGPFLWINLTGDEKLQRFFEEKWLKIITSLIIGIIVILIIFIGSWPYLWNEFPQSLLKVFSYYRDIGTGTSYQPPSFYIGGFNTFPILWIVFTTPPATLFLAVIGIFSALLNKNIKGGFGILLLSWFFIPIVRVMIPGASIYGGVRQILEFLPAIAILAGLGAWQIYRLVKTKIAFLAILLLFIWPVIVLVKMHPNQNVYFNFLIGGLKGAKEINFPSWGNSYGNAYLQGIKWLNVNAEKNARIALIQGTEPNAPKVQFRDDIDLRNANWSGMERNGEYLMELTFNNTGKAFYYTWEYVDKLLVPVNEIKVDGVSILKIWKNDLEHTRERYKLQEKELKVNFNMVKKDSVLEIDFKKKILLSAIHIGFDKDRNCVPVTLSFVETSVDGKSWQREKDWIPFPQVGNKDNLKENFFNFYFAARYAQYVRVVLDSQNSCVLENTSVKIFFLE